MIHYLMSAKMRRVLGMLLLSAAAGCAAFGLAGRALPGPTIHARYKGLKGQALGVMVWADRGIRIDKPNIQLDTANTIQRQLRLIKADELQGIRFPYEPSAIYRYQKDYPQTEAMAITDVAPHLKELTRLIYVEIQDFRTRSEEAVEIFRGSATATIQIVEIVQDQAKVAYREDNLRVAYPRKGLDPALDEQTVYFATVGELADAVAKRFYTHEGERE